VSVDVGIAPAQRPARATVVIVAAGGVVLLARPFVGVAPNERVLLFATAYLVLAATSLTVPVTYERPRVASSVVLAIVLAIGLASIVLASTIAGSSVATPHSSFALPLSVLAAVAEEALFRRVAYARLARFGALVAVAGSAILFGIVHLPAYGVAALPVDLGAGLLFGWQRWASGTWLVPAGTHVFANAVAIL
jgi:membrane protease YdiL (CAAX protease family)